MASTRYTGEDATLRGWLLSDPRFTYATLNQVIANGVPSEGSPRAGGIGIPARDDMAGVIEASGEQASELYVEALRGGMPRLVGARVGYRLEGENPDRLRGWNAPNVVTGCIPIGASAVANSNQSIVTLRTGDLLCARRRNGSDLIIQQFSVETQTWSLPSTSPAVPGSTSAVSGPMSLSIDSKGFAYLLVKQSQGWSLWRTVSADTVADGWLEAARVSFGLWEPNANTTRMRLFVLPNGDMAIFEFFINGGTGYVRQYASSDGGATFVRVAQDVNATTNLSDAAIDSAGTLGLARVTPAGELVWTSTASPWVSIVSATGATSIATGVAEAWLAFDPVGRWYVWSRRSTPAFLVGAVVMSHSDDAGATWEEWDHALNDYATDAAQGLSLGQACHSGGSMYLLHQSYDGTGTYDQSPILTRLGGWSGMTWIGGVIGLDAFYESAQLGSGYNGSWTSATWLPAYEPDDLACWTAGGTGTDANDSIQPNGRMQFSGSGVSRHMSATTAPTTVQDKAVVDCEFAVTAGGSTAGAFSGFAVILSDGVNGVQLTVSASTTAFVVRSNAGTLATVTVSMTTPMQFRAVLYYNGASSVGEMFYKRPFDTYWTSAYSSTTWPTYAVATGLARWGLLGATGGATAIEFSYFGVKYTQAAGVWPYLYGSKASTIADYIIGRQLTGAPAPIVDRTATGLRQTYLRGLDGPITASDSWQIAPSYDYPAANALPDVQPSPRRAWRSATDGTTETFAWMTEKTSISRHFGFAVFGANWRTARLEVYTASTATWSSAVSMDLAAGRTGLAWTRSGNVLRPNANDTTRYIWRGELVGATVDLGGGKLRRIASHTEGVWSTASAKHVQLVLESVDGTEGATGTMDVWATAGVTVALDQANTYDGWRLVIEPQDTVDGYYTVGCWMPPGPLIAAGQSHGWGGSATYEPSSVMTRSADFSSRARRLGPVARTWSWAWPDGIDQSRLLDSPLRPDFLATSAGTEGIANLNDAPFLVAGLLSDVASGERPIVAMEYIPSTSGTTLTDPRLFMLCRLASSVGVEHIQGDPERDAVYRISPITMQEIV